MDYKENISIEPANIAENMSDTCVTVGDGLPDMEVLTVEEVQAKLRVGRNKVYGIVKQVYKDKGPFVVLKFGNLYRIPKKPFVDWLNTSTNGRDNAN